MLNELQKHLWMVLSNLTKPGSISIKLKLVQRQLAMWSICFRATVDRQKATTANSALTYTSNSGDTLWNHERLAPTSIPS